MPNTTGLPKLITLAVHSPEYASRLKALLEVEGIITEVSNIASESQMPVSAMRVRIKENDLSRALRVIENRNIFPLPELPDSESEIGEILVPIDFTSYSYQAVIQAFRLAKKLNFKVKLLHTYLDPAITAKIHISDFYNYTAAASKEAEQVKRVEDEAMQRLEKRIRNDIKNGLIPAVSFSNLVTEGVPEDAVVKYAKENEPQIIIMGTRDAVQKERDLIGSVSAEVLDSCKTTPTITIPAPCSGFNISGVKKILFFAQLNQRDILGLDTLSRFFPDQKITVNLAHIPSRSDKFINPQKALSGLADYARRRFPGFDIIRPKYDESELEEGLNLDGYDMVVIVNRKKNALSRFLNPGLAHKLLFKEDYPMMVIPV